ncbi:HWE histidine kinase domain-containing protein [Brevundimonas vancanneytii]|uniref:histidine kinase n=1 Tax=Brevundimonas vancanneytii TaxID=1325724 RepID=A0A4P1K3M6_9CAUL|nr:HWE histidine kinase domain-containing protein [Brevundimonas vancanneytii]VTO14223.1 Blue-light-activated histidine kinase [Brevundimonas vancanneytii]
MRKLAKTIDLVAAFDSSPNPYMLLDRDLRFAGMNQAYLDVTQRRRDDLIGHHVMEMFAPGDAPDSEEESRRLRASFDKVLATGEPDHLAVLHYPVLTPGPDGEPVFDDRFWSCTHTPIKNEDGQVTHILQHTSDVTELLRLRQKTVDGAGQSSALDAMVGDEVFRRAVKIEANNQRLEAERKQLTDMLMNAPGFVAVLNGPDHMIQFCNEACYRLVSHRDILGQPVRDALPELSDQGHLDFLNDVYETGEPVYGRQRAFALRHAQDGPLDHRYIDFAYQPIRGGDAKIVGIFVQGHDVTDVVLAAERQKLMIDELNHRVKNTLATVQSIAMQTARTHQDPSSFAAAFQSRILALSHTHDLLTRSHWEGADLRAVLEHETQAHGIGRLTMNGPHVALSPARAVSLGMIFHELATNAAKYGALACGDGRVMVDWAINNQKSPRLHITWREAGGDPIPEPERRGFGTRLIERNVRHDLHGTVQLSYPPEGFCAEISLPLETETL